MSDIDQIEDIIENSAELSNKQKGPLRWAVRKVREELSAPAPKPYRSDSRFDSFAEEVPVAGKAADTNSDPFADEDVPF